jgi:tRNA modification GTPase
MLSRKGQPIVAVATAPGRGAVGIVRVSGVDLTALVQQLLDRVLRPREATYLPFKDASGQPIDHGLALLFPGPHSFTGEDVLELQAHGGPVVLQLLLARCLEVAAQPVGPAGKPCLAGLRLAEPGEFSERAFLNGKMDLAQAEAIADLIDANTEAAARSAAQSLAGVFSREIGTQRDALIRLRMLVEATLDFPEEEIDFLKRADASGQLERLRQGLHGVLQAASQGALLREGITVVIAGQPNAGKSSLLNALAGAELAIVTPVAGTTRDKVQQTIQIEGVPIHVVDTAGLRASTDSVEQVGIARAWQAIEDADVVLFLHDLTRQHAIEYVAADADLAVSIAEKHSKNVPVIEVWNKSDAVPVQATSVRDGVTVSATTGAGLERLRQLLLQAAGWQSTTSGQFMARARHVQALNSVQEHLSHAAQHLAQQDQALDVLAEELRLAQNALSAITGEFTSDDLLGAIFSQFCIGK